MKNMQHQFLGNVIKPYRNNHIEYSQSCHSLIHQKDAKNQNKGGYRRKSCEGEKFGINGSKMKQFNTLYPLFQTQEYLRIEQEIILSQIQERLLKKKSHRKHKHKKEHQIQSKGGLRNVPFQAWDQNRSHKLHLPCQNKISIQSPITRRLEMKQNDTDLNRNSDQQNHNKNLTHLSIPLIQLSGISNGQQNKRIYKNDYQSYFQSQRHKEDQLSCSSESESSQNSCEFINQAPIFNISFYRAQQFQSTKQQYRLSQNKTINKFVDKQTKTDKIKQNVKIQTLSSQNSKATFYQPIIRNKTQSQLLPLMSNTGKSFFTQRNEIYKIQQQLNPYSRQETERWISQQLPQPEIPKVNQKKHSIQTIKNQDKENNFKTIFNDPKPKEKRSNSNFISSRKIFIL